MTPLIQELERRGLVRRDRSASDRRSVALSLTADGEEMLARLTVHAAAHDRRLGAIAGHDKHDFIALLKKIADELE